MFTGTWHATLLTGVRTASGKNKWIGVLHSFWSKTASLCSSSSFSLAECELLMSRCLGGTYSSQSVFDSSLKLFFLFFFEKYASTFFTVIPDRQYAIEARVFNWLFGMSHVCRFRWSFSGPKKSDILHSSQLNLSSLKLR